MFGDWEPSHSCVALNNYQLELVASKEWQLPRPKLLLFKAIATVFFRLHGETLINSPGCLISEDVDSLGAFEYPDEAESWAAWLSTKTSGWPCGNPKSKIVFECTVLEEFSKSPLALNCCQPDLPCGNISEKKLIDFPNVPLRCSVDPTSSCAFVRNGWRIESARKRGFMGWASMPGLGPCC